MRNLRFSGPKTPSPRRSDHALRGIGVLAGTCPNPKNVRGGLALGSGGGHAHCGSRRARACTLPCSVARRPPCFSSPELRWSGHVEHHCTRHPPCQLAAASIRKACRLGLLRRASSRGNAGWRLRMHFRVHAMVGGSRGSGFRCGCVAAWRGLLLRQLRADAPRPPGLAESEGDSFHHAARHHDARRAERGTHHVPGQRFQPPRHAQACGQWQAHRPVRSADGQVQGPAGPECDEGACALPGAHALCHLFNRKHAGLSPAHLVAAEAGHRLAV